MAAIQNRCYFVDKIFRFLFHEALGQEILIRVYDYKTNYTPQQNL